MPTITEINGDNEEQQQRNHLAKRSNRLPFTADMSCDSQLD